MFRAHHPRAHLLLVGSGWGRAGEAHRKELIARYRVTADPNVTWLASVADVRPCYDAADVSVSPSFSEGHGAATEASAMGVPSIVSDAGGLPETVDEPAAGSFRAVTCGALVRHWQPPTGSSRRGSWARVASRPAGAPWNCSTTDGCRRGGGRHRRQPEVVRR